MFKCIYLMFICLFRIGYLIFPSLFIICTILILLEIYLRVKEAKRRALATGITNTHNIKKVA